MLRGPRDTTCPPSYAATVHTSASIPKTNLECSVDPSVASNALRSSSRPLCQLFGYRPGLRPSPRVIFPSMTRLGNRPSFCRASAPAKKSRRLRMIIALASCLLEGLRARKDCVVGTLSALEANDSQEDLVMRRSEPSEVLRAESLHHTAESQLPRPSAYINVLTQFCSTNCPVRWLPSRLSDHLLLR